MYVTLNAIGCFLCNLCFYWLIQFLLLKFLYEYWPSNPSLSPLQEEQQAAATRVSRMEPSEDEDDETTEMGTGSATASSYQPTATARSEPTIAWVD